MFSIVRSMISRDDTWHGRYGVLPGYGISLQDGFEDTFTASATAALEYGSFPYGAHRLTLRELVATQLSSRLSPGSLKRATAAQPRA